MYASTLMVYGFYAQLHQHQLPVFKSLTAVFEDTIHLLAV